MHILNMSIYVIGCVTLLVGLMWGVSEITAYLLLAHYDWKLRRNTKATNMAVVVAERTGPFGNPLTFGH